MVDRSGGRRSRPEVAGLPSIPGFTRGGCGESRTAFASLNSPD
jgi:hypothetical protein